MYCWLLAALVSTALLSQGRAAPSLSVNASWQVASEDHSTVPGRAQVRFTGSGARRLVVWEAACQIGGRLDAGGPPDGLDPDQSWLFEMEPATDERQRSVVRVRYRHIAGGVARPPEERAVGESDDGIHLNELSARRTCGYDRIVITLVAVRNESVPR